MYYRISTPARLHFALINQSGMLGRCNGGFGVSISKPVWDIEVSHSDILTFQGNEICAEQKKSIKILIDKFSDYIGTNSIQLHFNSIIKSHCGFGSKTSLLLSVAQLINHLFELRLSHAELINITGRGGTSGVGINLFENGGFVVDNGHVYKHGQPFLPSSYPMLSPAKKIFSLKNNIFKIIFFRFSEGKYFGQRKNYCFKHIVLWMLVTRGISYVVFFFKLSQLSLRMIITHYRWVCKEIQGIGFKKIEWEHQGATEREFLKYWNDKNGDSALCLSSIGPGLFYIGTEIDKAISTIEGFHQRPLEMIVSEIDNKGAQVDKS